MKKISILILTVVLLFVLLIWVVFCTETGLFLMKKTVNSIGSPFLTIGNVEGKLTGKWSLNDLALDLPGAAVSITRVDCRLRPSKLLDGELGFVELNIKKSKVILKDKAEEDLPSDSPIVLPEFFFPFGFAIENIEIEDLSIVEESGAEIILIEKTGFYLSGRGHQLNLNTFFLKSPDLDLTLHGSLDFSHDWILDFLGGYRFSGKDFEDFSGTFSLSGPLNNPQVELGLDQPAVIRASGSVTHLLENPQLDVTVIGRNVDLFRLSESWPEIRLNNAEIHLSGTMEGCHGDIAAEGSWSDLKNMSITSSLSSNWDGIDFQSLSLMVKDSSVTARESWISWNDTFRWGGKFFLENFNPAFFNKKIEGKIDVRLRSKGKVVENGVEASFEISSLGGKINDHQIAVQGNVFLAENKVYTDGLHVESGEMQGSAFIQQGSFSWADSFSWSGDITFDDFDPAVFYSELPGQVSGHIVGEGQQVEQGLEGSLVIKELSGKLRGQPLNGKGNIEFRDGRLKTEGLIVQHGSSEMRVKGIAGDQFSLDITLVSPDISQFIPVVKGSISVKGRLTGTPQEPELKVVLDGGDLTYREHRIVTLKGDFDGQPRAQGKFKASLQAEGVTTSGITISGGKVDIAGSIEEHELSLQVSSGYGELQIEAAGGYSDKLWEGSFQGIVLFLNDYGTWKQTEYATLAAGKDGFKLADLCLSDNGMKICLDGELNTAHDALYWQIKSSLSGGALTRLNSWPFFPVVTSGILNGQLEAEGNNKEVLRAEVKIDFPEADFEVGGSGEELRHILLDDTLFTGSLSDNKFQGALHILMPDGASLQMSAEVDNAGKFSVIPGQLSLAGGVEFTKIDLDFLVPLTGYLLEPTGKVNGLFSLSGTLTEPRASGEMSIIDGGIALPDQGIILEDINLELSTEEESVRLNCAASSGAGKLTASGRIEYADEGISGNITVRGEEFKLFSLPEYEIQISPDVRFLFNKEKGDLSGTVKIPTARITPEEITSSVSASSDVVFINGEEEVKEVNWPFYTNLNVQLGDDVLIDGYGLKGRLEGELQLEDNPDSFLTCTGGLDFIDSSFSIFGRSLDIERGQVLFTGGPIDNPGIDFRAQKKVSDEEAMGDGYVVGVDVNGLVQNLQFHLFSVPFMEDSDILSHLLVGHPMEGSSEEESSLLEAAVAVLGLKGGSAIFQQVGNVFSVDDVHLEGSSENEDMSLVVGKRITKDLYFGYDINMFNQLGVFRVRYGLTHGFSIETQTSTESTGTDIFYIFER